MTVGLYPVRGSLAAIRVRTSDTFAGSTISAMHVELIDAWRFPSAREFFVNTWPMYLHEIHGVEGSGGNAVARSSPSQSYGPFWECTAAILCHRGPRRPVGRDAVIDKLVYAATNPVLDDLVDRVRHWPGVNGLAALLNSGTLRAMRPLHFFRRDGLMPDVEEQRATERQRTGRRVLGRRAVLAQSWRERPTTCEPRRNLRPQVASRSRWTQIEALLRNRAFAAGYAEARERGRAGLPDRVPARHLLAAAVRITADPAAGDRDLCSRAVRFTASFFRTASTDITAHTRPANSFSARRRHRCRVVRRRRCRYSDEPGQY
jgi:hypothetical protein